MADTKVEDEVAASTLTGAEILYCVQSGGPRRTTVDGIAAYASAPPTSDGRSLGTIGLQWSDLYLASGAVINFGGTNVVVTHSSGKLSITGLSTSLAVDGLFDISAATAGRIQFPVTQVPSANANTLDDYEEGTFTPGITFGGTNAGGFSSRSASYIKIGKLVYAFGSMVLSSIGGGSGSALITQLPFSPSGNYGACSIACNTMVTNSAYVGIVDSTSTIIGIYKQGTSAVATTQADFNATSQIFFGATYQASA